MTDTPEGQEQPDPSTPPIVEESSSEDTQSPEGGEAPNDEPSDEQGGDEEQSQGDEPADDKDAETVGKIIEDEDTKVAKADPVIAKAFVEEPAKALLDIDDADSPTIARVKHLLRTFLEKNSVDGTESDHFIASSDAAMRLCDYIAKSGNDELFKLIVTFFEENAQGACSAHNFLKGFKRVPANKAELTNTVYHVFTAIAQRQKLPLNPTQIQRITGSQALRHFYERRYRAISAGA